MYRPTITVGVGGYTGWQALAWAVAEAITTDARLVVGARRLGSVARLLLGSVSRGAVEQADGSVTVVPMEAAP
jgi:nucleotide-binding universal stress UspA family protein